jgi:hypothetical protein
MANNKSIRVNPRFSPLFHLVESIAEFCSIIYLSFVPPASVKNFKFQNLLLNTIWPRGSLNICKPAQFDQVNRLQKKVAAPPAPAPQNDI